jgi:FtsP/CotA-like multicopper oxidase with cupredoxin domain
MKSTLYNVQHGLGGLWVIRDPTVEMGLPSGKYEKFIVFSKQGDARTTVSPDAFTALGEDPVYERGATYRFRVLNAAFDNSFNNVVFAAYYTESVVDGKTVIKEIDPSDSEYDLEENKRLIPFTVIGTDTTLFRTSIDGVSFLNFGPAERVDLLIRFDTALPSSVNNVYFVCFDQNENATVVKYQFSI